MLFATFALAISAAGQIAAGIHLVDVRFNGDTRLDGVDVKKCATDLKSQLYEGTEWTDYLVNTVLTRCLQDKGYMKAAVKASTQQLLDKQSTHQFVITFDIDAGPQYRVGNITFKNNHAISDAKALRDLFPIKDGDIFDRNLIAKGLGNLREFYSELGYINFISVPDTKFDDEKKLIFLEIDGDEGKQFYVRRIEFQGFREPDAGNLPARFDEREQETESRHTGLRRRRESAVIATGRLKPLRLLDSTLDCTYIDRETGGGSTSSLGSADGSSV